MCCCCRDTYSETPFTTPIIKPTTSQRLRLTDSSDGVWRILSTLSREFADTTSKCINFSFAMPPMNPTIGFLGSSDPTAVMLLTLGALSPSEVCTIAACKART